VFPPRSPIAPGRRKLAYQDATENGGSGAATTPGIGRVFPPRSPIAPGRRKLAYQDATEKTGSADARGPSPSPKEVMP